EVTVEGLDCFEAVRSLEYGIAPRRQPARIKTAQAFFVFDQQDCALPGVVRRFRRHLAGAGGSILLRGGKRRFLGAGRSIGRRDMARQEDTEGRALPDCRFRIDEAAGLLDDAVDRGETEPGALADPLGGADRPEDATNDVR